MGDFYKNDLDDKVDDEIFNFLNPKNPQSFFLFAGAGSGKTRTLVNVLERFEKEYGIQFRVNRKKIAIITYTNVAANEILSRLKYSSIFNVSTIHSFAWELIQNYTNDIREWLKKELNNKIVDIENLQNKSKNIHTKSYKDRDLKMSSYKRRLSNLNNINKFAYNPNGDNLTENSISHSEVIKIAAFFIDKKNLMKDIIICRYPIILIDESQDTKKELIDSFFNLLEIKKLSFSLGLFGDTMQRIYTDGKENLDRNLPSYMFKPIKEMNHRSNKRIVKLINDIRSSVDEKKQKARIEKKEGFVRFFICLRDLDKSKVEQFISTKMSKITDDDKWDSSKVEYDVKTLILEHHMAARRLGFIDFFAPLYKINKLKNGLLDGSLSSVNLFANVVLFLVNGYENKDKFELARIVKKYSNIISKDTFVSSDDQISNIINANESINLLLKLFDNNNDPTLFQILDIIVTTKLFPIPSILNYCVLRKESANNSFNKSKENESGEEDEISDDIFTAWEKALETPFSQIINYSNYISGNSKFGTHQGVKGQEFDRVMVVIDDEEANGFSFSYDRLFKTKELSDADNANEDANADTSITRTNRLFYVACSRAKESLAVVAYTDNVEKVKETIKLNNWFLETEIEVIQNFS